jgi:L-aspartate semialdehyde sulfurtransferase ferredoxin
MPSKKLVLTFPPNSIREPLMYHLVKDFDLMINIVSASISADEAGHMVVELDGPANQLADGLAYIDSVNVKCEPLSSDVRWLEDCCVHCTACTTTCPTGALSVDRSEMRMSFDEEKCIGCELCISVCSYGAMEIHI